MPLLLAKMLITVYYHLKSMFHIYLINCQLVRFTKTVQGRTAPDAVGGMVTCRHSPSRAMC